MAPNMTIPAAIAAIIRAMHRNLLDGSLEVKPMTQPATSLRATGMTADFPE
jgi:hypothetical protein